MDKLEMSEIIKLGDESIKDDFVSSFKVTFNKETEIGELIIGNKKTKVYMGEIKGENILKDVKEPKLIKHIYTIIEV